MLGDFFLLSSKQKWNELVIWLSFHCFLFAFFKLNSVFINQEAEWVACTFSLVAQLKVVLPQLGDQLRSLQLYLWVWGQVVGGRALPDHCVSLDIQVPVDTENRSVWSAGVKIKTGSPWDKQKGTTQSNRSCFSTHTAGLYGVGVGVGVVGVATWAGFSSGALLQGLTPGVLGEIGVVGSTWKENSQHNLHIHSSK